MKNYYLLCMTVLVTAIATCGAWGDEKTAVAALQKKGGFSFKRDESQTGSPVIEVRILGCDVELELLKELPGLKKLRSLSIHTPGDNLDVVFKGLGGMKDLCSLDVQGCELTDFGVQQISKLKTLHTLDLGFTRLTDVGLKELGGLKQLKKLYINDTGVTERGLKEIVRLSQLEELNLWNTKVGTVLILRDKLLFFQIVFGFVWRWHDVVYDRL